MGHYLPTKRVSIRGGADLVPCFAKPHLATYYDKKATLFKYKPKSNKKYTLDYPNSLQTA